MKNIKKILFIAICFGGVNAFGQNSSTTLMNSDQRTEYINQHVSNMSPDQKSKLADIEIEYLSEIKAINQDRIDSLRQATDGKIRMVLSNMQYEQYQSLNPYTGR